jgi:putative hydrolase of the HAD superfamily
VVVGWLVCDYGEVISRPQGEAELDALAALSRRSRPEFDRAYWAVRADYDRGSIDLAGFWGAIVAGELDKARLAALHAEDNASWTHLDPAAMAAIEAVAARGRRLALLSNAPADIARRLDAHPWFQRFEHRLFSCDLGLTKPDPAIYAALIARLDTTPAEVVFIDDKAANVDAARALGIDARRYRDPADFEGI